MNISKANLNSFDAVCVLEDNPAACLQAFIDNVLRAGRKTPLNFSLQTDLYMNHGYQKRPVSDDVRQLLATLNAVDLELYHWARETFGSNSTRNSGST